MWGNIFERFGGVHTSKTSDMSAKKFICEVWRCLDFKRIVDIVRIFDHCLGDNGNEGYDDKVRGNMFDAQNIEVQQE